MKKGKILIILVIAVLMLLPACDTKPASDSKVSPDWTSEKLGIKSPFENREEFEGGEEFGSPNENGKVLIETGYGYLSLPSLESMTERTPPHLIVRGKVLGFDFGDSSLSDAVEDTYYYTMYHVEPTEVFRGTPKTDENGLIDVKGAGGQIGNCMHIDTNFPELTVGEEYVFFLNDPILYGEGVNTNDVGYYDYAVGGTLVCYSISEDGKYFTPNYYGGEENGEISYEDFKTLIDKTNAEFPVPTDSEMRKEYVDRWRYTIDTYVSDGRMTQEEYDEAKAWLDDYEFYTGD